MWLVVSFEPGFSRDLTSWVVFAPGEGRDDEVHEKRLTTRQVAVLRKAVSGIDFAALAAAAQRGELDDAPTHSIAVNDDDGERNVTLPLELWCGPGRADQVDVHLLSPALLMIRALFDFVPLRPTVGTIHLTNR